ncbi:ABC transporter substrate-binding protein [Silvanigrella aquatica]|uniref:Spermidine/putrescine ABC transporter substrate-binding protein n=1 Tax=Silvanigrella aquatica TaxID=1915309 RepID=A0A1L4CZP6_9BACT|nr:PotD/PotF family extracellular solute-binding protein [Silvanigrella aquatica]APJ03416.1 hypothetical protein AXG55_05655 [Silvanigrella aquatica]
MKRIYHIKVTFLIITIFFIQKNTFALKKVELNIMQWEGYLSSQFSGFITYARSKGYDVSIKVVKPSIVGHENTVQRISEGGVDIITPSSYFFKSSEGNLFKFIEPIDEKRLKNYANILKKLKGNYATLSNRNYGIPFTTGSYGLAYNTEKVPEPTSWKVLWDPSNKNKYSIYKHAFQNFFLINLIYGKKISDAFIFDKIDIKFSKEKAKQLINNANYLWSGYSNDLNKMDNLNYVTTWGYDVIQANKKKMKWKIAHPIEGEYLWLDSLSITKEAANNSNKVNAFYLFCDYILSPEVQVKLMREIGSTPVNIKAKQIATKEEIKSFRIGDESYFKTEKIFDSLDKRTEKGYNYVWDQILSEKK